MKSAIKNLLIITLLLFSFSVAREDTRSYISDVETPAVWVNPRAIKVYITPDATKEYVLSRSFEAWDDAMGSDLNFDYVKDSAEADITIQLVDKLEGTKAGVAHTKHMKIQGQIYLGRVDIYIARHNHIGFRCTDAELGKVALHEIGHAIGILGHSENINDIMYYSTSSKRLSTLSSRDVDTVKRIYGF